MGIIGSTLTQIHHGTWEPTSVIQKTGLNLLGRVSQESTIPLLHPGPCLTQWHSFLQSHHHTHSFRILSSTFITWKGNQGKYSTQLWGRNAHDPIYYAFFPIESQRKPLSFFKRFTPIHGKEVWKREHLRLCSLPQELKDRRSKPGAVRQHPLKLPLYAYRSTPYWCLCPMHEVQSGKAYAPWIDSRRPPVMEGDMGKKSEFYSVCIQASLYAGMGGGDSGNR